MANDRPSQLGFDDVVGDLPRSLVRVLQALNEQGWAMEWLSDEDDAVCRLVLYSSARIEGRGPNLERATREAIARIDVD